MDIILQDLEPREAFYKWFSSNKDIRPNGRELTEIPSISVKKGIVSTSNGSAMVNYGETVVIAAVKTEVAEPEVKSSNDGYIVVNFNFGAGARSDIKPGPPSEDVQSITEKLSKIITNKVIDLKSLCLVPKMLSMVVYVDVVCVSDTGYAMEAALLACMVALKNGELPVPTFNEDEGLVKIEPDAEIMKLDLLSWPLYFSFSVFNDVIIFEPDNHEKTACGKSKLNIVVDLMSNNLIELEKHFISMPDSVIFDKVGPVIKNACDKVRILFSSLDLQ